MQRQIDFYEVLQQATAAEREALLRLPLFAAAVQGRATRPLYIAFLTQAYHHVRHTVPLMMACGARLGRDYEWLREKLVHYIDEEHGHQEWILEDIAACGGDVQVARDSEADFATEMMVAYAYDTIARGNPVAFFGMVHVLEGTSTALATEAAAGIASALHIPNGGFRYLRSHGALDVEHVDFFRNLVNRISAPRDRADLVHAARRFYWLYGDVFRGLQERFLSCN